MTSAKDNINLDEAFNKVMELAFERSSKNEENFVPEVKNLKITKVDQKKKKRCC